MFQFHAASWFFWGYYIAFVCWWTRAPYPLLTLVRHLGYSWSPGRTLKEIGTLSARRLAQKASQMARCTALYTTSRPVKATKAMGRQHSSGGSSHWEPAIVMVQQWIYLHKTEQHHCNRNSLKEREKKNSHHVHYTLVQQGYNVVSVSTFWRQKETFYNLNWLKWIYWQNFNQWQHKIPIITPSMNWAFVNSNLQVTRPEG